MKIINIVSARISIDSKLLLIGLLAGLVATHLILCLRTSNFSFWSNALLLWIGTGFLLWSQWNTIALGSDLFSRTCGSLLITVLIFKIAEASAIEEFIHLFPLLAILGVALIASGFKGLKQYWRELLLLFFLVPSQETIEVLAVWSNVAMLTAQFATKLLWCLGFTVSSQETHVILPTGSVYISPTCAGVGSMFHLLGLSALYLMLVPTSWTEKILLPFAAILVAFINNVGRVAILVVLAASPQTLEYWHKGGGSHVNSAVSVLLLGLVCLLFRRVSGSAKARNLRIRSD